MAIITPYGDPNAHGSLGNSISFRRRFGKVILEKKPYPKQPNSSAQITQRTAFRNALNAWYGYNAISKIYFNLRSVQLSMIPMNLFISATLKSIMPSTTKLELKRITDAQIINLRGSQSDNGLWGLHNLDEGDQFCHISDTENVYYEDNYWSTAGQVYLSIDKDAGSDITYLFRDGIWIEGIDSGDNTVEYIFRIQSKTLNGANIELYISDDGSTFLDSSFTQLYATNNF